MDLTAIRNEIKDAIRVLPGIEKRVFIGRHEADDGFDATVTLRLATGPESEESLAMLDMYMNPEKGVGSQLDEVEEWENFSDLAIVRCSGHTMFPVGGGPPLMGAEWTIKVMA